MRVIPSVGLFTDIRLPAVLLSLLISAWFAYSTGVINNDGIYYVAVAGHIASGDWSGACQVKVLHCWLLFPALIAAVEQLTGLGLEYSAFLLNAMLSALMVFIFLTLVRDFGGGRVTLMLAAFVILCHPFLSDARGDVIRDHGYWALYLLLLYFFIGFWRDGFWLQALAWVATAVVATLFRIEGIVFLLLMPLVLLVDSSRRIPQRLLRLLKLQVFTLLLALVLFFLSQLDGALFSEYSGRLFEPLQRLSELREQLQSGLSDRVQIMGEQVLGRALDHYARSALWAGLLMVIFYKVINTLSPLYALLFVFKPLRTTFNPPAGVVPILVWLLLLNLLILLIEVLTRYTLSGRFVVPLVLTLLLVVPFLLESLIERWREGNLRSWQRWLLVPAVVATLLFMTVDGFYSSGSGRHDYLRDAGYWLQGEATETSLLFSNNGRVIHYSGLRDRAVKQLSKKKIGKQLKRDRWRKYDYIAIQRDHDGDATLIQRAVATMGEPLRVFSNNRQDRVYIFYTRKPLP